MARHDLRVKPSVATDLRGVPKANVQRILDRIEALRDDPRAPGCEKLAGAGELYRVRLGVYRIVHAIHDEQVIVEVIRVGHRGQAYRARQCGLPPGTTDAHGAGQGIDGGALETSLLRLLVVGKVRVGRAGHFSSLIRPGFNRPARASPPPRPSRPATPG